jgi:hypothetical protein
MAMWSSPGDEAGGNRKTLGQVNMVIWCYSDVRHLLWTPFQEVQGQSRCQEDKYFCANEESVLPPYSYSIVDDAAAVTLSSWGEVSGTQTRRDEFESKSLYSKVIKEGARVENCALTEEFSAGKGIKFMGIDLRHN